MIPASKKRVALYLYIDLIFSSAIVHVLEVLIGAKLGAPFTGWALFIFLELVVSKFTSTPAAWALSMTPATKNPSWKFNVDEEVYRTERWPVMFVAVLMILDGFKSIARDFEAFPEMPLAGMLLSKPAGYSLFTAWAIACVVVGMHALRLRRWARNAAIALWALISAFALHQPVAFIEFLRKRQITRGTMNPRKEEIFAILAAHPTALPLAIAVAGLISTAIFLAYRKRFIR